MPTSAEMLMTEDATLTACLARHSAWDMSTVPWARSASLKAAAAAASATPLAAPSLWPGVARVDCSHGRALQP